VLVLVRMDDAQPPPEAAAVMRRLQELRE